MYFLTAKRANSISLLARDRDRTVILNRFPFTSISWAIAYP
jgi:hypothetical protein